MSKFAKIFIFILLISIKLSYAHIEPPEIKYSEELGISKDTASNWLKAIEYEKQAKYDDAANTFLQCSYDARDSLLGEYFIRKASELYNEADGNHSSKFISTFKKNISDKKTNPFTADVARYVLHEKLLEIGKIDEAKNQIKDLGYIRDWMVIGPFDNEGKVAYDKIYPPEIEFDLDKSYEGKARDVKWRQMGTYPSFGYVDFYELFRPRENVCAYAAVVVHSDKKQNIAIRLGSDSAVKVFLNYKDVYGHNAYREYGIKFDNDLDHFPATLEKGYNLLVAKITNESGNWGFLLRLTKPNGQPIEGVEYNAMPDFIKKIEFEKSDNFDDIKIEKGFESFLDTLCNSERTKNVALFHALRGEMHQLKLGHDINIHPDRDRLREAIKLNPDIAHWYYLLSKSETDRNIQLKHLKKAISLDPHYAQAYVRLGNMYDDFIQHKAEEYFQKALEINHDITEARINLIIYERRKGQGWDVLSLKKLETLAKEKPDNYIVQQLNHHSSEKTILENIKNYEKWFSYNRQNRSLRDQIADYYAQMGKYNKAAEVFNDLLNYDPYNTDYMTREAVMLYRDGQKEKAIERIEKALQIAPEDKDLYQTLGFFQYQINKNDKALQAWSKALELEPHNDLLSNYVRKIQPDNNEKSIIDNFHSNLLVYGAMKVNPAEYPGAPFMFLLQRQVTIMNEDGTSSKLVEKAIRILREKGTTQKYFYAGSSGDRSEHDSKTKIKLAKVIKADGTVNETSFTENGRFINISKLDIGDTIIIRSHENVVGEALYKKYFGTQYYLQSSIQPIKKSEFTLLYPFTRELYHSEIRFNGKVKKEKLDDLELNKIQWIMTDIPAIKPEIHMPQVSEILPIISVSSFKSWDETAEWIRTIIVDAFEGSPELDKKIEDLVKNKKDRLSKIKSIYNFVANEIQYSSFPLAGHGYRPFKPRDTFDRKWGDCKDKAVLMMYMLDKVNVKSHFVVVRALDEKTGQIDTTTPGMHLFNHAIVFIPDENGNGTKGVFADGTANFYPYGTLPDMDQGAVMFVIRENDGILTKGPIETADFNYSFSNIVVKLNEKGDAVIDVDVTRCTGAQSSLIRNVFQAGQDRDKILENILNKTFGDVKINNLIFSKLSDVTKEVNYKYTFRAPGFAKQNGKQLIFNNSYWPKHLTKKWAPTVKREKHINMSLPEGEDRNVTYLLPDNFILRKIPQKSSYKNKIGEISFDYKTSEKEINVFFGYKRFVNVITNDIYGKFRKFCQEVDRLESQKIIIEKR